MAPECKKRVHSSKCLLGLEDAGRIVPEFVDYYNGKRLHYAIGYIAPRTCSWEMRIRYSQQENIKLTLARKARKERRRTLVAMGELPHLTYF